jgi:hypothetical protein
MNTASYIVGLAIAHFWHTGIFWQLRFQELVYQPADGP